jgi:HAD superfamily hydrolase (TIGR01509 family)
MATDNQIQAVLIDVDGTLVLSNDIHAQSWVDAFAVAHYDISFDQVRPLIGMGGDQVIPRLVPGLSDEAGPGKQITDYRKQLILHKYADQFVPTKGARQLIQKLRESGLKLIVASSASSEELQVLLKAAQVDDLLPEATTSSDAKASKPAPDIVEAALAKIQIPAEQVIMLGDTPYDVEAAGKAGVRMIALRCGGFSDQALSHAVAIYNDPADLLEHYQQSPLA